MGNTNFVLKHTKKICVRDAKRNAKSKSATLIALNTKVSIKYHFDQNIISHTYF